ncbi:hypothetical protein AMK16_25025 [Streptomyces sp. CB00455]|uniref:hypothetical protein n=1 Tax=Streptomyces sp. CB00455 TaxID=1703927 RepID=UPI00093B3F2C|nr:hypothetical protein [Streptomyces sp. CB00455]OKK16319.1 hypothetical protein AMK16_25025 [Streptomyces sp. CB00455]
MSERSDETAAGLARIEGYLISQAALGEARKEGQAFARALTWLGPGEQDEIGDRFAQYHLRLRRDMLAATVARSAELKEEYTRRYVRLRRRVTGLALAAFGLCTAAVVLLCRL